MAIIAQVYRIFCEMFKLSISARAVAAKDASKVEGNSIYWHSKMYKILITGINY